MKVIQTAHVPARKASFRPREYAHIVFMTAQPEALIDWYCKVLGLEVVMRHELINFLTWDDSQDRLAIVNAPTAQPKQPNTAGLHHAAYQVASLKELVQQYRYLKSVSIEPVRCMNHGVATSLYYADPDGNQIELTVEAFNDVTALNRWLDSKAFDLNPVGIILDPEALCRRVESGEPETEILKPVPDHADRLEEVLRGM